jgi:hypothetical protein
MSALIATERVLSIRVMRMKGAARRATDRALSPMTGKDPKRYGIRIPSGDGGGRHRWSAIAADRSAAGFLIKAHAVTLGFERVRHPTKVNKSPATPEAEAALPLP